MAQPDANEQAVLDAAREAFACPVCTANRGEHCREHDGGETPGGVHDERVERLAREAGLIAEPADGQPERDGPKVDRFVSKQQPADEAPKPKTKS